MWCGVNGQRANQVSSGIFLIGLAIVWYTNFWWPGILFVIGAASIVQGLVQGRGWYSFHSGLWMIGLGAWALLHFHVAVLFLFIGLAVLAGAFVRPPSAQKPVVDNTLE